MHPEVRHLIEHFNFQPLPVEGTLFASTYRSSAENPSGRPLGTAMLGLYCAVPHSVSLFHRLSTDEVWHFYGGDPLRLILLHPDGSSQDVLLGPEPLNGQFVQFVVPAGTWQAGHMLAGGRYSLFGCTLAPGFTGEIFEGGTRQALLPAYPDRANDIEQFACPDDTTHMPAGFAN